MEELDKIIEFIDNSPQRSIFCYPWWLEAVAPGQYEYITTRKKNQIKSIFPVVKHNKLAFTFCKMPKYTQYLGVLMPKMKGKYAHRLSKSHRIMDELIQKLPKSSYYNFRLHFSISNWLPFYWRGFRQTTNYTYLLNNIKEHDKIWQGMRSNIRRAIRKAKDVVEVVESDNIETLIELHRMTLKRKNRNLSNYEVECINRIFSACSKRERCVLLLAKDKNNKVHSSQLFIWDDRMAYYLIGGNNPDFMSSGAAPYVMWEGIKYVSTTVDRFNFEGSMIYSVERFFRGFGAKQIRYFNIKKFLPNFFGAIEYLIK